jgi:leucyl-tRNA synthetase
MLAITKYADRLDADLDTVDYLPVIKTQQRNWIGRSEGVELQFSIQDKDESIEVFTTRIDTLFGVTFLVLAPEHPLIERIVTPEYQDSVQAYQTQTKSKSDLERQQNTDKTGVFTGAYAIHPLTQALIPIWISDYVLMGYGTGAVMAVPAHDERDKEFAEIYQLLSIEVITADGYLCNSEIYNQLSSEEAKNIIITVLEEKGIGQRKIQYKLRDWVFSRQRYWGEPFPIIWIQEKDYQNITGDIQGYLPEKPITRKTSQHIEYAVPLHPDELPLELPPLNSYKPQGRGEGPLAQIQDWVQVWYHLSSGKTLPKTESRPDTTWVEGVRETDTMPNWAGSSWYYLRYIDPHNTKELASRDILEQWLPVDIYNGGMEHVTVHLLYSRFWHKFLYDIGVVPTIEPYQTRIAHGMILAEGGVKMSKSKGNTVDPMEMVDSFGADSLRLYEMFMGPYDESIAWDTRGLIGCNRFLKKLYQWVEDSVKNTTQTQSIDYYQLDYDTHSLIKKITEDIEKGKYNTCVSSCMEYLNTYSLYHFPLEYMRIYIQLLAPFAPHIAEELWEMIGETQTIHQSQWPIYDESKLVKSIISYQIHINGKMRGILDVKAEDSEDSIKAQALNTSFVQQYVPNIATAKVIINQTKNIIIIIA